MLIVRKIRSPRSYNKYYRSLWALPYCFTFANALLGFLSILKSLDGEYRTASLCILLAACMDAFDGRLARAFNLTSCFGMELDSLCDAVSFCLAPTILIYSWLSIERTWLIILLGIYICAGLARLARFNAKPMPLKSHFMGLPTTMAAFFLALLVLSAHTLRNYAVFSSVFIGGSIAALALLMISTIPYPSLKHYRFFSRPHPYKVVIALNFFILYMFYGSALLCALVGLYILIPPIYTAYRLIVRWLKKVA